MQLHACPWAGSQGRAVGTYAQEGTAFLTPRTESQMVVDRSVHGDLLRVNFNISFPALPCEFASLDISDALGTVRLSR